MNKLSSLSFMLLSAISLSLAIGYTPGFSLLAGGYFGKSADLLVNDHRAYAASVGTVSKMNSGLMLSDSLTNNQIDTTKWNLNGDAVEEKAPHSVSENSSGLHIAVQAASVGQWAGYYAETPTSFAHLYHAVLTIPFRTTLEGFWNTGLYVQTSNPMINYVTCAASVDSNGITWEVVSTRGDANSATEFNSLWRDTSNNQPYTRDCTIITNGNNSLDVYLDHKLVYSNNSLNLQMPSPFNGYLEVQTTDMRENLTGIYNDFYTTASQYVTVTAAPVGGKIDIIDSTTNSVLDSKIVDSNGTASFDIGKYHMPLSGSIKVYNSSGSLVASSLDSMPIWAGDLYEVSK